MDAVTAVTVWRSIDRMDAFNSCTLLDASVYIMGVLGRMPLPPGRSWMDVVMLNISAWMLMILRRS